MDTSHVFFFLSSFLRKTPLVLKTFCKSIFILHLLSVHLGILLIFCLFLDCSLKERERATDLVCWNSWITNKKSKALAELDNEKLCGRFICIAIKWVYLSYKFILLIQDFARFPWSFTQYSSTMQTMLWSFKVIQLWHLYYIFSILNISSLQIYSGCVVCVPHDIYCFMIF